MKLSNFNPAVPEGGIWINGHTYIKDVGKFIKSHMAIIEGSSSESVKEPYRESLALVMAKLDEDKLEEMREGHFEHEASDEAEKYEREYIKRLIHGK